MSVDDPKTRELLDACRPNDSDLQLDELRPLSAHLAEDESLRATLHRSQRLDAAIQGAVQRVPVPAQLEVRLLEALERDGRSQATPAERLAAARSQEPAPAAPAVTVASSLPPAGRRNWMLYSAASLVAIAAAAALLVALLPNGPAPLTSQSVSNDVREWVSFVEKQKHPWRPKDFPWERFPPSSHLRRLQASRWQPLPATPDHDEVVCYDMTPPGTKDVLLFVVATRRDISQLPAGPRPIPDTQMLSVGVWRERGRVYALAVAGNSRRFEQLVRPQIAALSPRGMRPF